MSLASWRRVLAGVFDCQPASPQDGDPTAELFIRSAARFLLSDLAASPYRLVRSNETIASGPVEGFAIRLQASGALSGRMGDLNVDAQAGDIVLIDLLQTLDIRTDPPGRVARDICLWVPRGKMLAAFGRDDMLHGLVLSGASPAGAMIGGALRILGEQAANISAQEFDALCDGVIALAAKALAPVLATPRAQVLSPAAAFVTIRRYIDRNLRKPNLDADSLADTFGVSRASLYRLFEPVGGVASYIRKARLNLAYQEIVGGDFSARRIGPIAHSLGFKNVSAFNRTFREHYGMSPREARVRAVSTAPSPLPAAPERGPDETQTLAYWLRRIGAAPAGGNAK